MPGEKSDTVWAICPVQDCTVTLEHDPEETFFCPSCEMEMISKCPVCRQPITDEEAQTCAGCGESVRL